MLISVSRLAVADQFLTRCDRYDVGQPRMLGEEVREPKKNSLTGLTQ